MSTGHSASAAGGDVDTRGFVFALEPVRRKQQWQLDRMLADLARAQRALVASDAAWTEASQHHEALASAAGRALQQHIDPTLHRRTLDYLAHESAQLLRLAEHSATQRDARDRCRAACTAQQLRIDAMARHKDESLSHHAADQRRHIATEQDRDWIARSVAGRHRKGSPP